MGRGFCGVCMCVYRVSDFAEKIAGQKNFFTVLPCGAWIGPRCDSGPSPNANSSSSPSVVTVKAPNNFQTCRQSDT